jgi:multidrug efflux pump subunit AcrA (membrane-fusion protein)
MRHATPGRLVLAGLGCALLAGCGARSEPDEAAVEPVVVVRARAVEVRSFDDFVTASGQWRSSGEIVVAAPFAGTVDSVAARVGDRVRAGEACCWLATRESQAAVRGAALMAEQARDEASRAEAARALEQARRDYVRVPLLAPRAGVVVRRSLEPGAQVAESGEVLAIVPSDAVVFEAHVPVAAAARLRRGQRATIGEEGRTPRAAIVQRTLPVASGSDQTTLVWLTPLPGAGEPELDRFGTARIFVGTPRVSAAVPDSAVVEDDLTGETRVAVVDATGRAIWTRVTLGAGADGWRELEAPALPGGTPVIVEGLRGLPDSARVKLAP